ncbi:MAG: hypothetical protein OEV79_02650 [candidate division WOR-3 bacterium]|nr:hypothetical protein [candidate division WOR-3 bacterium]
MNKNPLVRIIAGGLGMLKLMIEFAPLANARDAEIHLCITLQMQVNFAWAVLDLNR